MELFEVIRSFINGENKERVNRWAYDQLREYLLALTRGREFLLSSKEYPEEIQLSKDWQEILDRMRQESVDGHERWALVGFKIDKRALYLPEVPSKGTTTHVPSNVILETLDRAKWQSHLIDMVGDIHTHPKHPRAIFSAGDLYTLLISDQYANKNNSMIMVLGEQENTVAFKTRDTESLTFSASIFSQESFEKYWYERNGFEYKGNVEKFGAERAIAKTPWADGWKVNLDIADRHNLVLYKGKPNGPLIKQFPQRK